MRWLLCFLGRHDDGVLETRADRIRLRCPHCWRVSPGWQIEARAQAVRLKPAAKLRLVKGERKRA